MNFIYKLIDFIDNLGNDIFIPNLIKAYTMIKTKLSLLKIILIDYFIIQNWFINGIIFIAIFAINDNNIIGGLIGALLTFNLIDGYNYYAKYKKWQNMKSLILSDLNNFIFECLIFFQYHKFPFSNQNILSRHLDLDKEGDEIRIQIFKEFEQGNSNLLINFYNSYKDLFIELENQKFNTDNNNLINYMNFLKKSNERIEQNLIISTILFNENINLFNNIKSLNLILTRINRYNTFYNHNAPEETIELIITINKLLLSLNNK